MDADDRQNLHGWLARADKEDLGKLLEYMGDSAPAVSMAYVGLQGLKRDWFNTLRGQLEAFAPNYVLPQIGLHLPRGAAAWLR